MIADSASGVSITRLGPNSSMKPSVTLNAPPKVPMSSPIRKTRSSERISSRMASEIACRYVIVGISGALLEAGPRGAAVLEQRGLVGEQAVGDRVGVGHRRLQRALDGGLDLGLDAVADRLRVDAERLQALGLPVDRVLGPPL